MHSPSFAFLPSVVVTSGAWFAAFFLGGMVRGGGVPLSPSKSLVLFLGAPPARYDVRAIRARSNDKTVRVPTYSSHQSVTPRITSFRLFINYSSHEYSSSYTIQVMNTRVCILFKS